MNAQLKQELFQSKKRKAPEPRSGGMI